MRAIVHTQYGPPEVAQLKEIEKPIPKGNELLIKVYASTVNRTDCGFRSAEYFISRFWSGLWRPKYKTLGNEFAGIIEEVGKEVMNFNVGDRVFGHNDSTFGAHAEYMTIAADKGIATMPNNLSFEEAAPICEGAHYALCDIRAAKVQAGQKVLVNGATGAIGSAAVQLLKHFGIRVTAVCDTKNITLLQSLGADIVIDYTKENFTQLNEQFDFVFDAVGKSSFSQCKAILAPKGIYISTELGKNAENIFLAMITPLLGGKKVRFPIPTMSQEDIIFLKDLVEKGHYKPVIDKQYPLESILAAYQYAETGQKTGNLVIKIK